MSRQFVFSKPITSELKARKIIRVDTFRECYVSAKGLMDSRVAILNCNLSGTAEFNFVSKQNDGFVLGRFLFVSF